MDVSFSGSAATLHGGTQRLEGYLADTLADAMLTWLRNEAKDDPEALLKGLPDWDSSRVRTATDDILAEAGRNSDWLRETLKTIVVNRARIFASIAPSMARRTVTVSPPEPTDFIEKTLGIVAKRFLKDEALLNFSGRKARPRNERRRTVVRRIVLLALDQIHPPVSSAAPPQTEVAQPDEDDSEAGEEVKGFGAPAGAPEPDSASASGSSSSSSSSDVSSSASSSSSSSSAERHHGKHKSKSKHKHREAEPAAPIPRGAVHLSKKTHSGSKDK